MHANGHVASAETQQNVQHDALEEFGGTSGTRQDSGTIRAAPGFSGQSLGGTGWDGAVQAGGTDTPPWTDLDEWRARYRRARDRNERINVTLAWGRAAGGTVQDGETLVLRLPPDLPNCLALAELRCTARDLKVLVP
jgi:hypothetical protein